MQALAPAIQIFTPTKTNVSKKFKQLQIFLMIMDCAEHCFLQLCPLHKVYQSVQGCTKVYQSVLWCTKMYQTVLGCTKVYQSILVCTRVYKFVPKCTRV